MRVKSRWHKQDKERAPAETGSTLAYIIWKTTLNSMNNMQDWGFEIGSLPHHFRVGYEFAAFLLQAVDRYAYGRMDEEERAAVVSATAKRLVEMISENQFEMLGPGDYKNELVNHLNSRLADYAELTYTDEGPGYSAMRYFAERVVAGLPEENQRWMAEQLVDVEAPDTVNNLFKALRNQIPDEDEE